MLRSRINSLVGGAVDPNPVPSTEGATSEDLGHISTDAVSCSSNAVILDAVAIAAGPLSAPVLDSIHPFTSSGTYPFVH